ncbi:O-linked-mannose beta-1-2-N-acetylglucosaminyltransferase 1-like 15 [Homarus americanus]|uniref:Alpha-1,3-mannosyl-glycoprotein 2-beta-N-acetylglucosaminyltransferase n=1 Tax=Homarus americanus TaxID=6706 RepID=A0A8J5MSI4_HOMAM|nr:O-linked-mannose beta-1-2-N-acetylglucosaminyltransferase 1-like 15 [Homarus americanus]
MMTRRRRFPLAECSRCLVSSSSSRPWWTMFRVTVPPPPPPLTPVTFPVVVVVVVLQLVVMVTAAGRTLPPQPPRQSPPPPPGAPSSPAGGGHSSPLTTQTGVAAASDYLHISVTSSAHLLLVTVNSEVVAEVKTLSADIGTSKESYTPWELSSGIHLLVLHPQHGRVMMNRVLTTTLFGSSYEVPSILTSVTPGHLVVISIKNDAAKNLTPRSRTMLARFGLHTVISLEERDSLAWVGTLGGPTWGEAKTMGMLEELPWETLWASGVVLDVMVPRTVEDSSCMTEDDPREAARAAFCRLYDGYGDLCSCPDPAPLTYHAPELEDSAILDVPLLLLAGNRPTYLYRSLLTLLRQPGGSLERILVLVDGYHPEVTSLLDLLQVQYQERSSVGVTIGAKISDQYRHGLTLIFNRFPNASKAILLEEDLLASPDFFSYFNQTGWLLEADPSLGCVSGWNDLGSLHVARDPRLLRRVEVFTGLGWMVSAATASQLLHMWPSHDKDHDWDIWMRLPGVLGGRECVVPDVSRTFHIGIMGSHASILLHAAFFAAKPVPVSTHVHLLHVDRVVSPQERPVMVFIEMSSQDDYYAWQFFARCLGMWDLDTRSHHRGLFRFFFYETEVFVVGYPFSDYSYLKPPWASLLAVNTSKDLDALNLINFTNRVRFRRPELERLVPYHDIPVPHF